MDRQQPPERGALHPSWVEWGVATLGSLGIEETHYQNAVVKGRLLESIALCYWHALVEHAQRRGLTVEDIGRRLGVNRSTYNRWIAEQVTPDPDKLFGTVVVVLREELRDIPFPPNRDIVFSSVARTLSRIREQECRREAAKITREQWRYVRQFMRHPDSHLLLDEDRAPEAQIHRVLADILVWHRRSGQATGVTTASSLLAVLDRWARPYVLFRIGLLRGWELFDEHGS